MFYFSLFLTSRVIGQKRAVGVAVAALPLVLKLSISGLCRGAAGQDGEKAQKTSCKTNENKHKADHLRREGPWMLQRKAKKDGSP